MFANGYEKMVSSINVACFTNEGNKTSKIYFNINQSTKLPIIETIVFTTWYNETFFTTSPKPFVLSMLPRKGSKKELTLSKGRVNSLKKSITKELTPAISYP